MGEKVRGDKKVHQQVGEMRKKHGTHQDLPELEREGTCNTNVVSENASLTLLRRFPLQVAKS